MHERFSLLLSLSSYLSERILSLCLKRRICLCYSSCTVLNFFFSLYSSIAVTCMHDILFDSVMSHTVALNAHTYIHIQSKSSNVCIKKEGEKSLNGDICHTSFSVLVMLNCLLPIAICMRHSFIVHSRRHQSMKINNI